MDLKPDKLLTDLANGNLPVVKTDNELTVKPETIVLLVLAVIIIILAIVATKKLLK